MLRVRLAKEMIMMLRILLLLICLQVTGAQAQHEITVWAVGSGSNKLYHCITVQNQDGRRGTGAEDQ